MMMFKEISEVKSSCEKQSDPAEAWAADNSSGKALAKAYIDQARNDRNPLVLAGAIRRMVEAGRWTGLEVGFAQAIAEAAL